MFHLPNMVLHQVLMNLSFHFFESFASLNPSHNNANLQLRQYLPCLPFLELASYEESHLKIIIFYASYWIHLAQKLKKPTWHTSHHNFILPNLSHKFEKNKVGGKHGKNAQENHGFVMNFLTLCIQYNSHICVEDNVDEIIPICSIVNIF